MVTPIILLWLLGAAGAIYMQDRIMRQAEKRACVRFADLCFEHGSAHAWSVLFAEEKKMSTAACIAAIQTISAYEVMESARQIDLAKYEKRKEMKR